MDWDPVSFAAAFGLKSLAELLFDRGAEVMDLAPEGYSALQMAPHAPNRFEILRLFLSRGEEPNSEGTKVPLFHDWLSFDLDVECVQELMRHGASCTMVNSIYQWNAMHYFAEYGSDRKVLESLVDNPADEGNRADISVRDGEGETPLHKLLRRWPIPIDILDDFLARGADLNINDKASEWPLYEAACFGENEAIKIILCSTTNVDDDKRWGRTALHAAAFAGQTETVKLLREHGADTNQRDKHNRTPLLFARLIDMYGFSREGGHQATAELLVEEQIKRGTFFGDINPPTKRGRMPLPKPRAEGSCKSWPAFSTR